jgi:hypothetical protein
VVIAQHRLDRADDGIFAQALASVENLSETQAQQQLAVEQRPTADVLCPRGGGTSKPL